MKYFKKLFSRQFYRSFIFWGLTLITTYTLVGFFLLPRIIDNILVNQVKDNFGWDAKVEKIELNPYTLTLQMNNLLISDKKGDEQLSFAHFLINFELRSIIEGAFTFADISLIEPKVIFEIDKDGISNFEHALVENKKNEELLPEKNVSKDTAFTLPKLLFDNIDLQQGNILIHDLSLGKTFTHQLQPISFNLKGLSTYPKNDGIYKLNIALGNEQFVEWEGTITLFPFHSSGKLKLDGMKMHELWDYISEHSPYDLKNAVAGFEGEYDTSFKEETFYLSINKSILTVTDLEIANKNDKNIFAEIEELRIDPLDFNLTEKELKIGEIDLKGVVLKIIRDEMGKLKILEPFENVSEVKTIAPGSKNDGSKGSAVSKMPFKWSIDKFSLDNNKVIFIDDQPQKNAEIIIDRIDLKLKSLSEKLSNALPFELSYFIDKSGENKIIGKVTPSPFKLESELDLKELKLSSLQSYISDIAKINIVDGKLSVKGLLNLNINKQGSVGGNFNGGFAVDDFNSIDLVTKKRLAGWEKLAVDPLSINFDPMRVDISDIALTKPYLRLIVTKDRSVNFAQLAVSKEKSITKTETKKKSSKEKTIPIKIEKIKLQDGSAYFADLSMQPQFGTSIENMNGEIKGLSSDDLARADIDLKGTIEEYGKMQVKGKFNPLGGDLYTDISARFDKIELTTMTPYSGRYAGYAIDKGKLSLQLDYKIANNTLEANNRIILDQFEFGSTIDSDESVSLPLKLALALFKDSNDIIDISLPIEGDIDDPDFKIGAIVAKGFFNLIGKAIASPFTLLANLVGGDPDELSSVAFNLGSAAVTTQQIENLDKLSEVLNSRPQLMLEIRVVVDPKEDGLALRQNKLDKSLKENDAMTAGKHQRRVIMKSLLTDLGAAEQAMKLQLDMQRKLKAINGDSEDKTEAELENIVIADYDKSLYQTLLDNQPLSSLELTTLAQERVLAIKDQLIKKNNVANGQIFSLQPSLDGKAENDLISTKFTLATE